MVCECILADSVLTADLRSTTVVKGRMIYMDNREEMNLCGFSRELAREMKEQHVTGNELARRLSCTRQYVYGVLHSRNFVGISKMLRIAEAMDCDVEITLKRRK